MAAIEAILDAMSENDGRQLSCVPNDHYCEQSVKVVREMLAHPIALPGLSDGSGQVGTTSDASAPTFLLLHWCRDSVSGRISLERAVHMLARDAALYVGLRDRGEVRPGVSADLKFLNTGHFRLRRPRLVADLPGGGGRLLQDAVGYRATTVAGVPVAEDDRLTGARPGHLVRVPG
jgi:N-acyl-D-aspartate/D-glutamate deacylase